MRLPLGFKPTVVMFAWWEVEMLHLLPSLVVTKLP